MIAIESKKPLMFPPASVGFVRMEINLIQNKPNESAYELRIVDTCFEVVKKQVEVVDEKGNVVKKTIEVRKNLGTNIRFKKYSYNELKELAAKLNIDFSDNTKTLENINQLFREGLLFVTQAECLAGISGVGKGMYFSEAEDWKIV